jgi:polar amino acid transport system substrate-binding protein
LKGPCPVVSPLSRQPLNLTPVGLTAVQGVKKIDLRRLTLRYGDGAHNMYWKTVHEGRPAKGMPTWKDVFTDEQLEQIYAFLFSVQSKE